jgi:hypothetical protein
MRDDDGASSRVVTKTRREVCKCWSYLDPRLGAGVAQVGPTTSNLGATDMMKKLGFLVLAAITVTAMGCGKKGKGGGSGRDPMKLCEAVAAKGFASACAPSTTPLDPALASATTLVSFTASHDPGGTGQFAIFPDEASAKSAFMVMRDSRGNLVGDYPTKIVIYWEMSGENPRVDDGLRDAIRGTL